MKQSSIEELALIKVVEQILPKAKEMVNSNANVVMLHQDAFAADYQRDEYMLLGMFIKYCGLKGKEVKIIGTNRETLTVEKKKV